MSDLNQTHDPSRKSHVTSANTAGCEFPIQNLPLGMFSTQGGAPRPGTAIGDKILDIDWLLKASLLEGAAAEAARAAVAGPALNGLMALGNGAASALRARLSDLLDAAQSDGSNVAQGLVPMAEAQMHLPVVVGNFTDFMTSVDHLSRFRPTGPLPDNFMSLPIAYHSRASSVRLSGDIVRPHVQAAKPTGGATFAPTTSLDYELEVGFFVAEGNALFEPVRIEDAPAKIFGYCLLNDWSIRDTQWFESTPLGPFQAKSVATTISPWVVTEEALRPFRAPLRQRAAEDLPPLPHLDSQTDRESGALDLDLGVDILTSAMRTAGQDPSPVTRANPRELYWSYAQMLTHHTANGCNLLPGDIMGSGTISGPTRESMACLAEINRKGEESFVLNNGESRIWLEDGDEVIFHGRAHREGFASIGFGRAQGKILPAISY